MSLFVGNISPNTSKKSLISLFEQFGHCEVEFYRRFAYITFSKDSDAKNALSEWNGKELHGTRLKVEFSQRKPAGYSSPASSPASEKLFEEEELEKPVCSAEKDSNSEEKVENNPDLLVVPSSFPTKTPPNTPNEEIAENLEIREEVFLKSSGKGGLMQEVTGNEDAEVGEHENVISKKTQDESHEKEVVLIVSIEDTLLQAVKELDQEQTSGLKALNVDEEVFMQLDLPVKLAEAVDSERDEEIEFTIEPNIDEESFGEVNLAKEHAVQRKIEITNLAPLDSIKENPTPSNPETKISAKSIPPKDNPAISNPIKENPAELRLAKDNLIKDNPEPFNLAKENPVKENLVKPVIIQDHLVQAKKPSGSLLFDQSFTTPLKTQAAESDKQSKRIPETSQNPKELIKNQLFDPEFVERELKKVNELCCKSEEKIISDDPKEKELGLKVKPLPEIDQKVNQALKILQNIKIFTETPSKTPEKVKFDQENEKNFSPFDDMKVERRLVPFHDPFVQQEPEPEKEKPSILLEMAKKSSEKSKISRKVTEEMKADLSPVKRKIKMPRKVQKIEKVPPESEKNEKSTSEVEKSLKLETPKPKTRSKKAQKEKTLENPVKIEEKVASETKKNTKTTIKKENSDLKPEPKENKKPIQSQEPLRSHPTLPPRRISKTESLPLTTAKESKTKTIQLLPAFSKLSKTSTPKQLETSLALPRIPSNSLRFMYDILDDETVSVSETAFRVKKLNKDFSNSLASCCVCGKELKLKSALVHLQSKFHIESS